jgi:hypothetical protein
MVARRWEIGRQDRLPRGDRLGPSPLHSSADQLPTEVVAKVPYEQSLVGGEKQVAHGWLSLSDPGPGSRTNSGIVRFVRRG